MSLNQTCSCHCDGCNSGGCYVDFIAGYFLITPTRTCETKTCLNIFPNVCSANKPVRAVIEGLQTAPPVGAISGGVIGGFLLLVILCLVLYWCFRKKPKQKTAIVEMAKAPILEDQANFKVVTAESSVVAAPSNYPTGGVIVTVPSSSGAANSSPKSARIQLPSTISISAEAPRLDTPLPQIEPLSVGGSNRSSLREAVEAEAQSAPPNFAEVRVEPPAVPLPTTPDETKVETPLETFIIPSPAPVESSQAGHVEGFVMVPSPSVLVSEPSTEGEVFTVATPTGSAETAAVASVASSPLRPVTEQSKPSTPSGDVRGPVYGKASPLHASVKATAAQIDAAGTGKPLMPKVEQRAAIVPRETKFAQERIFDTAGPAPLPPAVVQTTLIKSLNIPSSVGIPEAFHIIEAAGTLQVTDLAASVRDSPLPFGEEVKVLPVVDKPEIKDGKKYLFHVIIKPISLPSETSSLMLVGSIPEFGAWDPTDGVELAKRGEETWEAIVEVDSDVGFAEYKYAIVDDVDGLVRWEQGENRTVNWNHADFQRMIAPLLEKGSR